MLLTDNGLGLGNGLLSLGEDEFDVAGVGHVRVDLVILLAFCLCARLASHHGCSGASEKTYATVGAVCAAALLGGLVNLDVLHNEVASVETLGIGVGLGVLEETEEELGGLGGPAGAGDTKLLAYFPMMSVNDALICLLRPTSSACSWCHWETHGDRFRFSRSRSQSPRSPRSHQTIGVVSFRFSVGFREFVP